MQISTLHRRALQALQGLEIDEASATGHPSESVALLLGLRERDSSGAEPTAGTIGKGTPTDPAFAKGYSSMAHFNDLYRAVVEGAGRKTNVADAVVSAS